MAKIDLDPFAYLPQFNKQLSNPGALLVTMAPDDEPNVMTIGWASIGILWAKPVCIVYVRPSRYTFECLEHLGEFTVNAVTSELDEAVSLSGCVSGRDKDKFELAKLTALPARTVTPPIIEQSILHYECKVVHYNDMIAENLEPGIKKSFFPQGDFHRVYFGKIRACYGEPDKLAEI